MPINKSIVALLLVVGEILIAASALRAQQATYTLKPAPKTVAWGYYDAKAAPVLRVKSGDTLEIQTLITNSPKRLEYPGLPPHHVDQTLRDITDRAKHQAPR